MDQTLRSKHSTDSEPAAGCCLQAGDLQGESKEKVPEPTCEVPRAPGLTEQPQVEPPGFNTTKQVPSWLQDPHDLSQCDTLLHVIKTNAADYMREPSARERKCVSRRAN